MHRKRSWQRAAVAALFILLVGATAIPLLRVWQPPQSATPRPEDASGDDLPAVSLSVLSIDLRDNATPQEIAAIQSKYGIALRLNSPHAADNQLYRATVPAAQDRDVLIAALRKESLVETVEAETSYHLPEPQGWMQGTVGKSGAIALPKTRVGRSWKPNDPRYEEQWNFAMVGAEAAWTRSRGRGITVAVIDTGVALRDSPGGKGCRDFKQTRFRPGYNFIEDNSDAYDDLAHGTHVAGTIAETTNNNEGVAGLAFEATIMPLKVFGMNGWCTATDIADAIDFAVDHGAKIINLSLGGPQPSEIMQNSVAEARRRGALVVCSAGNSFGRAVGYPAAFPEAFAVSAVGPSGEIAAYSSFGPEVDLAAPGGDMMDGNRSSGVLQNTFLPKELGGDGDNYYAFQGTSMASPHVAAVAALIMSQGVTDPAQVADVLLRSTQPKNDRLRFGAGLLSADGATGLAGKIRRNVWIKRILILLLALLTFLGIRGRLDHRACLALAFFVGAFWPDLGAWWLGMDAKENLATFSALLPFFLFWEWETGIRSRIVASLSYGVATCFLLAFLLDGLSPLMASHFGAAMWPWMLANGLGCVAIGYLAAVRGRAV